MSSEIDNQYVKELTVECLGLKLYFTPVIASIAVYKSFVLDAVHADSA